MACNIKQRLLGLILVLLMAPLAAQDLKVMSYNIKYDNVNDTVNNWNFRKEAMVQLLKHYAPHFVGLQEVVHNQLMYLNTHLAHYAPLGVGREDGKEKGEYSPILYNKDRFALLQGNTFWLSSTPEKVSKGWDAALERICTYGLFQDRETGRELYVFNTHFDHVGEVARAKSVRLIVERIREINERQLPVVLMGDFNLEPSSLPMQWLQAQLTDAQNASETPFYGPTGTFNGFDPAMELNRRIDYVFVENLAVQSYLHIDDRMENNKHISDHLPVLAELEME